MAIKEDSLARRRPPFEKGIDNRVAAFVGLEQLLLRSKALEQIFEPGCRFSAVFGVVGL